ncbi:hypothetical protein [Actinoplanes subglobosus]|uniref:Uncharacterized protein n=1 Tax=Actinoplanes subglobosus TaxID=1547892 RepID=A0ABV8IQC2_9ACTN
MEAMYSQERLAEITAYADEAGRSAGRRANLAAALQRRAEHARNEARAATERVRARRGGKRETPPA